MNESFAFGSPVHSIEIFLRSEIDEESFDAVEIKSRISRIKAYVPSTSYERSYEIRGNWSDEHFALSVPNRYLESRFPLRLQAQFPGGSRLAVEAKVFEPIEITLTLKARNFIEGVIRHSKFSGKTLGAAALGCELSCPGAKKKITGADLCIECKNSRGAIFKLCC